MWAKTIHGERQEISPLTNMAPPSDLEIAVGHVVILINYAVLIFNNRFLNEIFYISTNKI